MMHWYIQKDARVLIAFNALVGIGVLLWVLSLKDKATGSRWKMRSISEMVLRDDSVGSPRIAFAFQISLLLVTVWQCLAWFILRARKLGSCGSTTGIWASFLIALLSSLSTAVLTIAKEPTGHMASAFLMFASYLLCFYFLIQYLSRSHACRNASAAYTVLFLSCASAFVFVALNEPVFEYAVVFGMLLVLWLLADAGQNERFKVLEPVILTVASQHELRL